MRRRWGMAARTAVAALVVALAVACGAAGTRDPVSAPAGGDTPLATETFAEPTTELTEPTEPEAQPTTQAPPGNPAISVARLPIGGGHDVDGSDPTLQCAHVNWIANDQAEIPEGFAVEITGAVFDPEVFEVVPSGCGTNLPNCVGYVMRRGLEVCDLAVRSVAETDVQEPEVGLGGLVHCPDNKTPSCAAFVEALGQQEQLAIDLDPPPAATPPPSPTDETTTSTATDEPTATGEPTSSDEPTATGEPSTGTGG